MRQKTGLLAAATASFIMLGVPALAEENAPSMTPASVSEANARIAVVQAHIDAYRSGNLDRFVATFAKDAEVHANGIVAVGHKQIRAFYALNFQQGSPTLQLYDNGVDGDVIWIQAGYVFPNGDEMCCSISEYEVRDGKISFLRSAMQ